MSEPFPPPGFAPETHSGSPFRPITAAEWGKAIETLVMFDMFGCDDGEAP